MARPDLETVYSRLALHDEEAEMSVLGAMMLDRDVAIGLLDQLEPKDFYKPAHGMVFDCLRSMYLTGTAIDAVTVRNTLDQKGQLGSVGGHEYLAALMQVSPIPANGPHYAKIVREKAILRQLAHSCGDILAELQEPGHKVEELVNRAQARMFEIAKEKSTKNVLRMEQIIEETFKQIVDFRQLRDRKSRLVGLPTGLADLDDLLCGLQPGYMYVIAGRPGMGKSSMCFRVMEQTSIRNEEPSGVLFFSLEMSAMQVCQQMLCSYCQINSHEVRKGLFSEQDLKKLAIGAGKLSDAPIWVDDSPDLSIFEIRARARRMKAQHNIGVILIDYLQKVRAQPAESRQIEISIVSSQIKSMAKELNVPVVSVAQLNRAAEGREDKRPMLSDLRESGAIEQDADVVMMVYREEYYRPSEENKNKCELDIVKNRTGPVGRTNVTFIKEWTRFANLSPMQEAPGQP
jgi:replicative DNA helicase